MSEKCFICQCPVHEERIIFIRVGSDSVPVCGNFCYWVFDEIKDKLGKDKLFLKDMSINELKCGMDDKYDLTLNSLTIFQKHIIRKYEKLLKKMEYALVTSNNLYCTDLKEVYESNKDKMFFLDNNDLLKEVKKELE